MSQLGSTPSRTGASVFSPILFRAIEMPFLPQFAVSFVTLSLKLTCRRCVDVTDKQTDLESPSCLKLS